MTEQVKSLRLRPEEPEFLNSQDFSKGELFLRSDTNEILQMGDRRGGVALLKADLSNIQGGSSGSGTVDFGNRTISADAFVGDGSQLTNLPVPQGVATLQDIEAAIDAIPTASTSMLGLVRVDGTTITINGSGVISAVGGGGGGGGVDLTAFSVGPEATASGDGALAYDNITGVFTYTPPDLSNFLDGSAAISVSGSVSAVSDTGLIFGSTGAGTLNITGLSAVSLNNLAEGQDLLLTVRRGVTQETAVSVDASAQTVSIYPGEIGGRLSVSGNATVEQDVTVGGTLFLQNILNNDTGSVKWESGSDFIIDMPGDLYLTGASKIRGVAEPLIGSDVATKSYVDGAASAFEGGTVPGAINITDTTASTNKDTGALIVNGGVGVEGSLYAGGLIYVFDTPSGTYTPVLTSASGGYNGGIISGTVFINNSTASTSATTGALRVLGGVGISGQLTTGPDGRFNGIRVGRGSNSGVGSDTNVCLGGGTGNDAPLALNSTGLRNIAIGLGSLSAISSAADNIAIGRYAQNAKLGGDNNIAIGSNAMTQGTGSASVAIGAGALGDAQGSSNIAIGQDALHDVLGDNNIAIGYLAATDLLSGSNNVIIGNNDGAGIDGLSNHIILADGSGNVRLSFNATGDAVINSNTATTTTSSGALVVSGGIGLGGGITAGGNINTTGVISTSNTTVSTSTSTGSIVTLGGIGAAGAIYAGNGFYGDGSGLTNVSATGFSGGTVSGATTFSSGVTFSSTTTFNGNMSTNNTAVLSMGSGTRQMLNLWSTSYALGVQNNTLYYRSAATFRWFRGGSHSNTEGAPGTGGTQALVLDASSNLTATGNVTAYSDERLKTDIETITDPIGKILQLDGVTFTRKDTGQRGLGVIAQQVQRVLPELIVVDENGYLSVAYGNLSGLLIEGVKAHDGEIQQLKTQVAAQQLMIKELMSRLAALEGSR